MTWPWVLFNEIKECFMYKRGIDEIVELHTTYYILHTTYGDRGIYLKERM